MNDQKYFYKWITFIGISYLALLIGFAIWVFGARPGVTHMTIAINQPLDSIALSTTNIETINTLTDLSKSIENQEKDLQLHYDLFLKARQDDADMLKFLTILGGLIIAIGTFFGIRNLKDFKDNISAEAQKSASKIADEIAKNSLRGIVSEHINSYVASDKLFMDMKSDIKEQIITKELSPINEDIDSLKSAVATLMEKSKKKNDEQATEEPGQDGETESDPVRPRDQEEEEEAIGNIPEVPEDI